MDVLSDLLQRSRARGAAFSRSIVHGDWGLAYPAVPGLAVHGIVEGEAYLQPADGSTPPVRVLPGDIVLVQGRIPHHLSHRPGAACVPLLDALAGGEPGAVGQTIRLGAPEDGPATIFFCGAYMFEGDLCGGLLADLPDVVHARPAVSSSLRTTMDLLGGEVLRAAAGQQVLLDRLLDVALVQILRERMAADAVAAPAWFAALQDPEIGRALRALHADPQRPWTVAELAGIAALSRSTFARRFRDALGVAPLAYLSDWRMALAREQLRDSDAGLAEIAAALGYASEFSFAAAFKRHAGVAPGRWRASLRAA